MPDSGGFKTLGECCASTIFGESHSTVDPVALSHMHAGVVLEDRYARNANGSLSHSRKELLVRAIRDGPAAATSSSCPDELWIIDKAPEVQLWSAKARRLFT